MGDPHWGLSLGTPLRDPPRRLLGDAPWGASRVGFPLGNLRGAPPGVTLRDHTWGIPLGRTTFGNPLVNPLGDHPLC
jgi:hypothetical protein